MWLPFLFRYYFNSRAPLSSLEIWGGRVIAAGRLKEVLKLAQILAEESIYAISSRSEGLRLLLLGSLVRKILSFRKSHTLHGIYTSYYWVKCLVNMESIIINECLNVIVSVTFNFGLLAIFTSSKTKPNYVFYILDGRLIGLS